MQTVILRVPQAGSLLTLFLKPGSAGSQVVLTVPDDVLIGASTPPQAPRHPAQTQPLTARQITTDSGFPPRALTEQAIVQILREHGGSLAIRDKESGWNIYDEIAARLGVSIQARRRLTATTGEPAWRPEVGYARKNLEQRGVIQPTEVSGRGTWSLAQA